MDEDVLQVSDWLSHYKNRLFHIRKHEDGDTDQIDLYLQDVSLRSIEKPDADDYLSSKALMLHGEGKIGDGQNTEELSQDVYEIPVTTNWVVKQEGNMMQIKTDRALYDIWLK